MLKRTTKPLRRRILIEEGLAKSSKKQHSENTDKWHLCKACSWNANQNKTRRRAGYKRVYKPPPSPPHPKEAFRTKGALWNAEQSKTLTTIAIDRRGTRKKPSNEPVKLERSPTKTTLRRTAPYKILKRTTKPHSTGETIVWRDPGGSWACLPPVYKCNLPATVCDTCGIHPKQHTKKRGALGNVKKTKITRRARMWVEEVYEKTQKEAFRMKGALWNVTWSKTTK